MIKHLRGAFSCRKLAYENASIRSVSTISFFLLAGLFGFPAYALDTPVLVPEKSGGERPPLPEQSLELPAPPAIVLPPVPPPISDPPLSQSVRIMVKQIKLSGNHVFSTKALTSFITPYIGRQVSMNELHDLRRALTTHYINQGYINSGAVIPDQQVNHGVIEIIIVEGRLSDIQIRGNRRLRDQYLHDRIAFANDEPLNMQQLQTRLQLLQQDRLVNRIRAKLVPGLHHGESVLKVEIDENRPYQFGLVINNWRSPSVGELRKEIWASHDNVSGYGDALRFQYGSTKGLDDMTVNYSIPVTARDARLVLSLSRSKSKIIEAPFDDDIDITNQLKSDGIQFWYPFQRTINSYLRGLLYLERRRSESLLFDEPFPNSPARNSVTVFRLAMAWLKRRENRVLSAFNRLSFGLNAFGATVHQENEQLPDGKFITWFGQFQWIHWLPNSPLQVVFRSDFQLSNNPLLPLEKFGIGGATSIRGYRENQLVRDNGWVSSLETRIPIGNGTWFKGEKLQWAAFYDVGWGRDVPFANDLELVKTTATIKTISSLGMGVRWHPVPSVHSQLYWAHTLRKVNDGVGGAWQDDGFHFSFELIF